MLQIDRIVGNNVILTSDPQTSREFVLFGKGIGFASKGREWIHMDDGRIEKRYRLDEEQPIRQYSELVENIDPEVIQISELIIDRVKERMGTPVQPKVYFALPNHIQFAVFRLRNGMEINNPFLHETRASFPHEYEIAHWAADRIAERFGIPIPDDEVGFLALHVLSCTGAVSVGELVKITGLLNRITSYIEARKAEPINRTSNDYIRLITHIRGVLERIMQRHKVHNPLAREIKACHPREFQLATEIAGLIREEMGVEASFDEIGYMAMHLHRFLQ